ncbi:hypothetical protein Bca52824_075507 [Brassica carinata]|uniref:Beta-amylase n=1 Tax=Brassica carinata TaxID=52824 RepID=A0A8X7PS54_BRACI|nr:hypothetical protein Bca52824_075507 [Brassica carinata]
MGPCGELRYPSYPESNGTRKFSGIGEFQCYEKYLRSSLQAYAESVEKTNWGTSGPHDAGEYQKIPEDTEFFQERWNRKLLEHGHKLLTLAKAIFQGTGAKLSGKIAGIYWHYNTRSNAAELTAGYYKFTTQSNSKLFNTHGIVFSFTGMENNLSTQTARRKAG